MPQNKSLFAEDSMFTFANGHSVNTLNKVGDRMLAPHENSIYIQSKSFWVAG